MKVVKNDNKNNSLTLAEVEAIQQFEASHRAGQAAPTCMVFCEEVGRFGITILEGRYSVEEARTEDEQWYRHEADGMRTPIDNPLEGAWQAAAEVREELKRKLDLKLTPSRSGGSPIWSLTRTFWMRPLVAAHIHSLAGGNWSSGWSSSPMTRSCSPSSTTATSSRR